MDHSGEPEGSRRRLFSLIAVGLGFAGALFLAEAAFRVAHIGSDQFLQQDPVLGVRFISGKNGLNQGECYSAQPTINEHGWRDESRTRARPDDSFRVLVLGDSFIAGLQVEDDETFTARLEEDLNAVRKDRFEVLNFAVPSWGTDQEYLALREFGIAFEPNLVILAFYAQNDVANNSMVLQGNGYPKPFFDVRGGELVEPPFIDQTPALIVAARRLAAPFRLYPWLRDSLMQIPVAHSLLFRLGIVGVAPPTAGETAREDSQIWSWPERWAEQTDVYARDYSDEWLQAWEITEQLILAIRDEAHRANADFLLLGLPDPVAVLPSSLMRRIEASASLEPRDQDRPSSDLDQFADSHSIEFVSLVGPFRERIADVDANLSRYYLSCDGHFTPLGHSLAAELVAPYILGFDSLD